VHLGGGGCEGLAEVNYTAVVAVAMVSYFTGRSVLQILSRVTTRVTGDLAHSHIRVRIYGLSGGSGGTPPSWRSSTPPTAGCAGYGP
jgi:hypothetical protein